MVHMLAEIRKELIPILIVIDLLAVWSFLTIVGREIPGQVDTLVSVVVAFYFGSRTGAAAATRALNGAATAAKAAEAESKSNG